MRPRLENSVVVITGASSGIGRAAALRFAKRGARLALAARGPGPLESAAEACRALGADVATVPADVGVEQEVERVADEAVARFGRIDVWVNAAAVMAYGSFEEIPSEVFERVLRTNLLGQSHGARAALRQFRLQGSGVLINLASVWGRVTTPDVSPYVVSKHAVRALSECLRLELRDEPDIDVATILPQAVDTPIFEHSGNYSGRRVRPVPPLLDPDEIASAIERCAQKPAREVTFGRAGRALELLHTFAPGLYARVAPPMFTAGTFLRLPARRTPGNVLEPSEPHRIDGGWRRLRRKLLQRGFIESLAGAASGLFGSKRRR
jgi:NAD(P)-dependent dehydrogenase (short-subunit alcohol dehydrogenase family)